MKNKNKTRYLQSILGAIMAVSAALILSCEQPDGPSLGSVSTGTGTVTLTVSKGEPSDGKVVKTILPTGLGDDAFVKYDFAFDFSTGEDNDFTDLGVTDLTGYHKTLLAGYWKVTVSAYLDPDGEVEDDEYVAAVGEANFTVTAGQTASETVHVKPVALASTATGTFEYTVDLSGLSEITVSSGTLTLTDSESETTMATFDGSDWSGDALSPVELAAGVYHLSIVLTNEDGLKAWHTDKVHIYAGFVSKQEEAFAFEDDDFQQVVYLAGTLTLPEGVTSENTAIKAYRDAGYGNVVDVTDTSYNDEDDEWLGFISVENIGTLYIKLVVTGSDSITYTYTTGADGVTVTKDGDDNITLTLAKADVGADATLDVDDLESLFDAVDDITLSNDFEVGAEEELTIAADKTLTVDSELTVAGEITVAGDLDLTAATVEVTGTVSVSDGGTLKVLTTATDAFYGEETSGKLVLAQGSTVTVGTPSSVLLATDNSGRFKFTSVSDGELELGPGSMTLKSGALDLINEGYWIQAGDTATIEDGATFNITADNTFHVSGTFTVGGNVEVKTGGALTGANGDKTTGTIVVKDGKTITGSANTNFYAAGGTKLSSDISPSGSDLTFTWDATLDSNNGGWRETAAIGLITADDLKDIISTAANDGGDVYLSNVTIEEPEEGTAKLDFGQAAVTVAGSLTVPANVTVTVGTNDDGGSLTVEPGATLEIAASATLEVKKGTLEVADSATLEVAGELAVDADAALTVATGGTVDLTKATTVAVAGELTVADTATLKVASTTTDGFYGKANDDKAIGSLVLTQGSIVTVGTGDSPTLYLGDANNGAIYSWDKDSSDGSLTLKPDSLTLTAGILVLNKSTSIQAEHEATIDSGATLKVADGVDLNLDGDLTVAGTLNVAGTVTVAEDGELTVSGTLTIQEGGEVIGYQGLFASVLGTQADPPPAAKPGVRVEGELTVAEEAELIVAEEAELTIAPTGKLQVEEGGTLTVNGVLNAEVAAVDKLAGAIATAKLVGEEAAGKGVVLLTTDFYTAANNGNTALVVDAGADRNTKPYTIKGLGTGEEAPALTVGILLANDNVTLDGVKIAVPSKAKAAATASSSYVAALSIGRYNSSFATDGSSKNVTVQNCDISYSTDANMAAGIYVSTPTATAASSPPQGIKILNNNVTATNTSISATQGIFFRDYGADTEVKNNIVSSSNTSSGKPTPRHPESLSRFTRNLSTLMPPRISAGTRSRAVSLTST